MLMLIFTATFLWFLIMAIDYGSDIPYSTRGGGSRTVVQSQPNPPAPTAGETSEQVFQSQLKYMPQAAQLQFDILNNPNYGAGATTQLLEQARQSVFPGESGVRDQLIQNVLANLQSPTGISPDQQTSIDSLRQRQAGNLQRDIQTSANLGGGLYGGRRERREDESMALLRNTFAEEDIAREERGRLNAIQSALPLLQILFPEVGITTPQFESPVPSANAVYGGQLQARGQDINTNQYNAGLQQQAANNRSAMQSALFGALGQAGAGYLGR